MVVPIFKGKKKKLKVKQDETFREQCVYPKYKIYLKDMFILYLFTVKLGIKNIK